MLCLTKCKGRAGFVALLIDVGQGKHKAVSLVLLESEGNKPVVQGSGFRLLSISCVLHCVCSGASGAGVRIRGQGPRSHDDNKAQNRLLVFCLWVRAGTITSSKFGMRPDGRPPTNVNKRKGSNLFPPGSFLFSAYHPFDRAHSKVITMVKDRIWA